MAINMVKNTMFGWGYAFEIACGQAEPLLNALNVIFSKIALEFESNRQYPK